MNFILFAYHFNGVFFFFVVVILLCMGTPAFLRRFSDKKSIIPTYIFTFNENSQEQINATSNTQLQNTKVNYALDYFLLIISADKNDFIKIGNLF